MISGPVASFLLLLTQPRPLKKGLLIIDDADSALLEHAEVLKQNLESDKFYLLAGCSKPQWVPRESQISTRSCSFSSFGASRGSPLELGG